MSATEFLNRQIMELREQRASLNERLDVATRELAVARERLGPAGYKIIQEVATLRKALEAIIAPGGIDLRIYGIAHEALKRTGK